MELIKTELNKVYNEDARKVLETIPQGIEISTTITSPPYFDMKDYQCENQIGFGQTYEDYLEDIKSIFEGIYSITKKNGSLWIIIDTFKRDNQVIPLPFDVSNKLKEIGWLLQDVIIWKKDKTVPWSSNGFVQRKFEYVLFFTKSIKFKYNKDRVRIYNTDHLKRWWVKYPERYNPKGKALDEVWEFPIPVQGSWGDKYIRHFCPLPRDMVATMIQLSTDEEDIVLDPFAGSGTVLSQSYYMKRNYLGFELNKEYIKMFENYLDSTHLLYRKEYESLNNLDNQIGFEKTILDLRSLKYAKILITNLQKIINNKNFKIFVQSIENSKEKNKLIKVKYTIAKTEYELLESDDKVNILELLNVMSKKKPFSKFGIEPVFEILEINKIKLTGLYGYSDTNTHSYLKGIDLLANKTRILSDIYIDLNESDYL